MDRIIYCLTVEHDLRLVVVAGLVKANVPVVAVAWFSPFTKPVMLPLKAGL